MSRAVAIGAGVVIGAVLVAGVLIGFAVRAPVDATSTVLSGVTIECQTSTGVSKDACRVWGDSILAHGPPSTTFEIDDLERLSIDRELWGFGETCSVGYFIGRYPADAVWTDEVPCIDER